MTDSLQATEDYSAARSTHPRVSLQDINDSIASEHYFTAGEAVSALSGVSAINLNMVAGKQAWDRGPLDILTICILVMKNGFTMIGKSAPASPENFDVEKGKTFAREDAIRQLWPHMGYALRERLYIDSAAATPQ